MNSILDMNDVRIYLRYTPIKYALPLDFAYPTFSWGVLFRNGQYIGLLHTTYYHDKSLYSINENGIVTVREDHILEGHSLCRGDNIRLECPSPSNIKEAADYVAKAFPESEHSIILYHLDSKNLSIFSSDEIAYIYSR